MHIYRSGQPLPTERKRRPAGTRAAALENILKQQQEVNPSAGGAQQRSARPHLSISESAPGLQEPIRIRNIESAGDAIHLYADYLWALTEAEGRLVCFLRDQQIPLTSRQRSELVRLVAKARRAKARAAE